MRRGLASLIIGLSLILASVSWAGFTLSHTVLDPGRSERLADQLVDNPDVRAALVKRLADALEAQLPPEVPIPRQVVEAGAATALEDPRVEALIRDSFVQVHQNALAGNSAPVVVDANALGAAGRDVLVTTRPELDRILPPTPPLELELPTAGLAWLGSVKTTVDRFTVWSALAAGLGAALAFAVARNRAAVLRRVAYWGYGTALFWLAIGFAIPWIAGAVSPTSAAIATAVVDVFFGAMIQPAMLLVVFATIVLLASFLIPAMGRRRGAILLQPRIPVRAAPAGGVGPAPVGGPPVPDPRPAPPGATPWPPRPTPWPVRATASRPGSTVSTAGPVATSSGPGYDSTAVMPNPLQRPSVVSPPPGPATPPPSTTSTMPTPEGSTTAWREGYGYLEDGHASPFDDAGDGG